MLKIYTAVMFIRETIKIDKKTNKKYLSYQLVEAFRTVNGPRQKILLTIGSDVTLSPSERKELANRIEEIVKGEKTLFLAPPHIENLAQHFAQLLLRDRIQTVQQTESDESDCHTININSIRHTSVRSIGCEYVAYSAYCDLGFDDLFKRLKFSEKQRAAAAASIIGRAIHPSSERSLYRYVQSRSALDSLLKISFSKLSLDSLYLISDHLFSFKKVIEKHLKKTEESLFNLKEAIILYDITNTFFEGKCNAHSKAKRGKSKEMRADCPLIAVGVVIDSEGFPKHSEIFEGNVSESATLQQMISSLDRSPSKQSPVIVLDSGIATKDNVEWLKSHGYYYIVMMKKKDRPPREECSDTIIRETGNQLVTASLVHDEQTGDSFLKCYSQARVKKEQDIKERTVTLLESSLIYLREGLSKPRRVKTVDKIHQKIGRLKEKYPRLAQHYAINVISSDGEVAEDIDWKYDEAKIERSYSGTYTLRTNIKDLEADRLWQIYVMLNEAESFFRCLKSEAGLRPNWHKREDRIDGHIFISILAYHLIATIRKKLKESGIEDSWETIRQKLSGHTLVSTSMETEEGSTLYLKQVSEVDNDQRLIYGALGLPLKPMKAEKTLIPKDVVSKK